MDHLRFSCFLGKRIHLGVTGSVAAYKSLELLRLLRLCQVSVSATLTGSAQRFVGAESFRALGAEPVATDMFGPGAGPDPFVHLTPGQTCGGFVIAPATASILAKLAHGMADDLLSTQALAFSGPLLLAPAMNPAMWRAQATQANWQTLLGRGAVGIGPVHGDVACGDTGQGKLAPVEHILAHVLRALSPRDLEGKSVLLTLGPTRERWDAVRYLSNPSSGLMGACLALSAWMRGARVRVVAGPTQMDFPPGIEVTKVATANQMLDACQAFWPDTDIGCCTAAVCDFRPVLPDSVDPGRKLKKRDLATGDLLLRLAVNTDILRSLGEQKRPEQTLIGFAAETDDLVAQARLKLAEKNLDIIVANRVGVPGSGFDSATNTVTVLDRTGRVEQWPELPKTEVAWRVWDLLRHL
ncbi:MAG: bifunctional phosphopantothenoylcysteine decarboxylase/phosphopantothenate--cysteine ligase CoaBC [Proteobacteria bacterium]|nr:bifunctional phosphopantothenoylcysteine decarboxylase/phosphopantothenate--cysteine ligase CoaBC [Pseudomonadota bacterium]MBU1594950.1 bifunctional phosphopantothenoylcysteine decarboxylase/phosphopantothenate--cysteine ligase CoaBC [Pseudomonadota bacterium]